MNINKLKFDEKGLIPAVIQDFFTKEVLTVAYMNKESLEITLDEKMTCFYSRSRKKLWRKGETSGNTQRVVSIVSDCDNDALVINVIKKGPACHLGNESCFSNVVLNDSDVKQFTLRNLYELIEERKNTMPKGSYTTYLFEKGMEKILKKVGEESTEVVIAAMKDDKDETLYEISDLCYHLLVLMVEMNISVSDIKEELFSRSIIDYKVKQETCGGKNEK